MDVTLLCHCCLRGAPDRAMTTPYSHLGKTETYADLLRDCFDINLVPVESGSSGICWACVGRLRDASDFKLQVQHSQAELQKASLHIEYDVKSEPADDSEADGATLDVLKEEPVEESEIVDEEETSQLLHEQPVEKSEIVDEEETSQKYEQPVEYNEIVDEEETSQELPEDPAIQLDSWDDVTSDAGSSTADVLHPAMSVSARARKQLAMVCSVRLERLRDDQPESIISEEKTYSCEECSKIFGSKSDLRKHIADSHASCKTVMSVQERYACVFCRSTFQTKSLMLDHEKSEHGVTKFNHFVIRKCTYCNYACHSMSVLKKHQTVHIGEKPFRCSHCKYACHSESSLQRHMRKHDTTEKPFRCSHCKYACHSESSLQRHMRKHDTTEKPFRCSHCKYGCRLASSLKRHMRKHTGEKPTTEKPIQYRLLPKHL